MSEAPTEPGGFVGDIYYGDPDRTTLGTHRWNGSEWMALASEAEALMMLLGSARARIADLERQLAEAREVKPLEWARNSAGELASGPYVVEQVLYTFYVRWGEDHIYPGHETLKAAIAHANQHRKADILSALKGTP